MHLAAIFAVVKPADAAAAGVAVAAAGEATRELEATEEALVPRNYRMERRSSQEREKRHRWHS